MAFRIETAARGRCTVFILSGRIEKQAVEELNKLLENQAELEDIVLDLKDVGVVDRDAMCFFARCEADGVQLENCTPIFANGWKEKRTDLCIKTVTRSARQYSKQSEKGTDR